MAKIPWRRHGPPKGTTPLKNRSVEDLEAYIRRGTEPAVMVRKAKRIRRDKVAGARSGAVRRLASSARARQICAAYAELTANGETRVISKLARQFGVSRPTIYAALKSAVEL